MAASERSSLLATVRPLRGAASPGNEPDEVGSIAGPSASKTTRGSGRVRSRGGAGWRTRRTRVPSRTRSRTRPRPCSLHTDQTARPRRHRSSRSGWTSAATSDTVTFGERVSCARREGSGVPPPGPSPSPTRAFYLVTGIRGDDDVDRSRPSDLVTRERYLVIVDTSLRLDAQVRVHSLLHLRRLKTKEPYNAEKNRHDALDFDLCRYLAMPAAICTADDRFRTKLRDAGTWQSRWVVTPDELADFLTEGLFPGGEFQFHVPVPLAPVRSRRQPDDDRRAQRARGWRLG